MAPNPDRIVSSPELNTRHWETGADRQHEKNCQEGEGCFLFWAHLDGTECLDPESRLWIEGKGEVRRWFWMRV